MIFTEQMIYAFALYCGGAISVSTFENKYMVFSGNDYKELHNYIETNATAQTYFVAGTKEAQANRKIMQ